MSKYTVTYTTTVDAESPNHAALAVGRMFLSGYTPNPKDFANEQLGVGKINLRVISDQGTGGEVNLREAYLATKGMDFFGVTQVYVPFNMLSPDLQIVARYIYDENKAADDTDDASNWKWRINTLNGKLHPSHNLHYINKGGFEVLRTGRASKNDWPTEEILGEDGYIYDQFDRSKPIVSLGKFPREYATGSEAYNNKVRQELFARQSR